MTGKLVKRQNERFWKKVEKRSKIKGKKLTSSSDKTRTQILESVNFHSNSSFPVFRYSSIPVNQFSGISVFWFSGIPVFGY